MRGQRWNVIQGDSRRGHPGEPFSGSGDVYVHFREHLAEEVCEYFCAVLLDNKHSKVRDVMVSKGSLTASIVHSRDVFHQVVRHSAAAVIFVHNLCARSHKLRYVASPIMCSALVGRLV